MAPILGYWNIRGYAQPIRLMLAYKEQEFQDEMYTYGPAPVYHRLNWLTVKYDLGLPFPNLPYYIDGDLKLTQSIAIMRYLARKFDLDPKTEEEKIRTDMIEQQALDFRFGLVSIAYKEDFDTLKEDYLKNLPKAFEQFRDYLGKGPWFAGERLTYVDFLMYEILDQHLVLDFHCMKDFPALEEYHHAFKKLPTIEKYMASKDFLSFPLNGDMAYFGSRRTGQK